MFENNSPATNVPKIVPDIKIPLLTPIPPSHSSKTGLIVGIILVFILLVAGGAWWYYTQNKSLPVATQEPVNKEIELVAESAPVQEQPSWANKTDGGLDLFSKVVAEQSDEVEYFDIDSDDIADHDEYLDTDGDGLPDYFELKIGTDPNNPDTDGDGYTDGEEVEFGFNPLGPGRIEETWWPIIIVRRITELPVDVPAFTYGTFGAGIYEKTAMGDNDGISGEENWTIRYTNPTIDAYDKYLADLERTGWEVSGEILKIYDSGFTDSVIIARGPVYDVNFVTTGDEIYNGPLVGIEVRKHLP